VEHTFSSPSPRRLLALWIRHLALGALGLADKSTLVAREEKGPKIQVFGPLPAARARAHLDELVTLFVAGHSRALPFLPAVSHKYVHGLRIGTIKDGPKRPEDALNTAVSEYDRGEAEREPHAPLAFDQRLPPFDARFDEDALKIEDTDFHRLALGVYVPIFEALVEGRP
jgi:exonuclease V gamma subunit